MKKGELNPVEVELPDPLKEALAAAREFYDTLVYELGLLDD